MSGRTNGILEVSQNTQDLPQSPRLPIQPLHPKFTEPPLSRRRGLKPWWWWNKGRSSYQDSTFSWQGNALCLLHPVIQTHKSIASFQPCSKSPPNPCASSASAFSPCRSQKEVLQTSRTVSAMSPISESQAWPIESI